MKNIIRITLFAIALCSCGKIAEYPIEPIISYVSFAKVANNSGIDDKGILNISFTDGDGDIGLNPEDTFVPFNKGSIYYYNFFISYFEKQKGVWKLIPLLSYNSESMHYDTITFNSRLPYITPRGNNKNIKGNIEIELFINNYSSNYDTIKYSVFIVDRAFHHSDTVETPAIIIDKR